MDEYYKLGPDANFFKINGSDGIIIIGLNGLLLNGRI